MKRKTLLYLVWGLCSLFVWLNFLWGNVYAQSSTENLETSKPTKTNTKNTKTTESCTWIKLNTNFPIIWNCIHIKKWEWKEADPTNAFPYMMSALSKIVVSLVLVICFILIIYAWILWSADKPKEAQKILEKVAITILLLWLAWVILKAINPVFFS